VRNNVPALFVIALVINVGMWLERFVIVVVSLHRDFLPSSWGYYVPRCGIGRRSPIIGLVCRALVSVRAVAADDLHLRTPRID